MPIEPFGPVVVGVDGSAESFAALDLAADEAAGRVTPLVVVHACPGVGCPVVPACAPEWVEAIAGRRRLLATALGQVGAAHPGLAASGELVVGDPAETLIARSAGASLVVVGHRTGGLPRAPLGPVAEHVARHAATPVLVHRPLAMSEPVESPRPVLLGVGDRAGTESTIEFAFTEADLRGAPLVAMYVRLRAGVEPEPSHPAAYQAERAQEEEEADRMLAQALACWSTKYPDVPVRRRVQHGPDAAQALLAATATAQLVVVGRPRRSGLSESLSSSVGHALVEHAGCPVVIVP